VTWRLCKRRNYPREPKATPAERRAAFREGILALIAPAVIVGSIVGGIATPTESAAIAVGYTLFLGLVIYRNTSVKTIVEAAGTAAAGSALVMLTVAASQIFAWLAVQERLGEILTSSMLAISSNVYVMLALTNLLMLVLGMFMELVPIIFILAPIVFPWLAKMGVSEVQFAVVMTLNLMIGMITPPVGLNLMVLSAISGVEVMRIFRACIPYIWALLGVLLLITYIPAITLTLPNLFYPAK
jgi:tripartite ATP-independent transporter DctM subunit